MIKDNRILDLTPIDTIFSIKKTSAETNGSAFEMEWELFPYSEGILAKVVNKLSGNGKNKLKMNFTVATYMSMLMNKYPDEIVSVKPPAFATKILSSLGKLRGCKI